MPGRGLLEQTAEMNEAACDGCLGGLDDEGGLLVEGGEVVLQVCDGLDLWEVA